MLRIITAFALVLVVSLTAQAADNNIGGEVQRWISQLDNEKFAAREDATDRLIMTEYKLAIKDISRVAEAGSPEARTRALHILSVWHRLDETSRAAVKATATRWQETKRPQMVLLGKQLVAKTKPKPVQVTVQTTGPVIFLGGGGLGGALPVFAVPAPGLILR